MESAVTSSRVTVPSFGANAAQATGGASQFVTCTLDAAEYGIDIMAVREIKGWSETTCIPHSAAWIRGVMNLRGVIVPILDLRARFGMTPTEPTPMHVVVIVQTGARTTGILVDAVSDIIAITPDDIRAVPDTGVGLAEGLLSGLVPLERGMVALVSLESLTALTSDDVRSDSLAS